MRFTVIKEDGTVYKDGKAFHSIDLSFLPANVRAIQWNVDHGELEFSDGTPNQPIMDLTPYQDALTAWQAAQDAANAPPPPPTQAQIDAAAKVAKDAADAIAIKADAAIAQLMTATFQQIRNRLDAVVNTTSQATTVATLKDEIAKIEWAIGLLIRKL